ncbi:MAG: hypothetical protein ABR985_22455 [Methanotrichaceae archaeon]|jgi:hypothetical protein
MTTPMNKDGVLDWLRETADGIGYVDPKYIDIVRSMRQRSVQDIPAACRLLEELNKPIPDYVRAYLKAARSVASGKTGVRCLSKLSRCLSQSPNTSILSLSSRSPSLRRSLQNNLQVSQRPYTHARCVAVKL